MKNKKISIISTVVVIIIAVIIMRALFSGGASSGDTEAKKKPVQVKIAPAAVETISEVIELTGSVVPQRIARLASPAEGPITNLWVREGDKVKAGDRILSIGRREGIEAQISSQRETVKKEEENLKRIERLVKSEAIPIEELERARAAYENARAQLVKAVEAAQDYSVTAPWSGIISKVNIRDGDYVVPRTPLVEIYDPVNLVVQTAVPERYAARINNSLQITIRLDAYPDSIFQARIVRIYPFLEERMRTRTIEAEIDSKVPILPGMFSRLQLTLDKVDESVVVPSQSILVTPSGGRIVYVVEGDTVSRRAVQLGIEQGTRVQILSGVSAGEFVVVAGNEKLKPGTEVRVIQSGSGVPVPGAENK
jgi:membrane fusion protein (multidrug efflux system)